MKYKVLFVDWDGTLSRSRFWDRWKNDSVNNEKYQLIQNVLFTNPESKLLVSDWMKGLCSYTDILHYLHQTTRIPYDELESELRYSCENMTFIDNRVVTKIQELRSMGLKVLIATDNMDTFRHMTVPALKLESLFDGLLVSDSLSALKNEIDNEGWSQFFSQYLDQNNIRLKESVLIDDSLDTQIVEKLGIDFLLVNKNFSLFDHLESSELIH